MRGIYTRVWSGCAAGASLFGLCAFPAQAQQAQDSGPQIEQVIVTAQRRDENLQSVPLTVNAYTSQTLQANNVISALDVGKLDTSVIVQAVDGNVLPFVRGVGTPLVTMGNESSIAVYLDGNYQTRLNPALLLLNNVDRIEILKGPQGTLFGRNASGGLLNIITANPEPGQDAQAKATVGYGNYDTIYGTGYFADSIGSDFAFSLAGAYNNQQDGWGHNITTGGDVWSGEQEAIRGKATYQLDEGTRIRFSAFYARMDTDQGQQLQVQGQKQSFPASSGLDPNDPVPELPFFDSRNDLSNEFVTENTGASVSIEHDLPFATLIETAAWNQTQENRPLDVDTTQFNDYNADFNDYASQFTNELRLVSDSRSPFQWTAGLYYYQTNQAYDPIALSGPGVGIPDGSQLQIYSRLAVRSYAAYAQGTYEVAPKTDITLGLRYTEDDDSGYGFQALAIPGSPLIILGSNSGSKTFSEWSWRAALDYHFNDDTMGYVSINRGFKSGTFNLVPFSGAVKPEILTAYETGIKSEFWDNRARLNGSVFYYDYQDAQVNTVPAPGILDIQNAKGSEVYGLDVDGEIVPMDGLTLKAGVSLLSAKYTDFPDAAFYFPPPKGMGFGLAPPVSMSADGNYLSRAPKVSFNLGAQYIVPLAADSSLAFGANYSYIGDFYWDPDNRVKQKAYGLLDAQISYTFPGDKYALRLWGSNLTDEHYYANEFESAGPQGSVGTPAAPRTFGVMFDWSL